MADPDKPILRPIYAFRREGKKMRFGRWLEIGMGKVDADGTTHFFMDRTPIGGFSGYVLMPPLGSKPPEVQPERPGETDDDAQA